MSRAAKLLRYCVPVAGIFILLVTLCTGCGPAVTPGPAATPRPHTYLSFEEAYAEADRAVKGWDYNAVISSAQTYTAIGHGDRIVPGVDGRAAVWLFEVVTPNCQTGVTVFDGRADQVGWHEKGGAMICVGGSWYPAPMATDEVLKRGSSVCFDPLPVRDMALPPQEFLPLAEVIDLARNAGYDSLILSHLSLQGNTWTLTFEEDLIRIRDRYVHVQVDARTGAIESVFDSATATRPTPEPK
jgi:hypothetical protein